MPPSPNIPVAIKDLSVVERGERLVITSTAPQRTTDGVLIKKFSQVDLRIGPDVSPFDFAQWSANAKQYELAAPSERDPEDPKPLSLTDAIPASDWEGKDLAVAIRTSSKEDRYSSWSNVVRLRVVKPLDSPDVRAKDTAKGVALSWPEPHSGVRYNIQRQGPSDKTPVALGTMEKPEFLDITAQYETKYVYTVVAVQESADGHPAKAESLPARKPWTSHDVFPPSTPQSVAALAAANTIELSWERSPEPDLKGYYVYRSTNSGPFERQGSLVNLPSFSDHTVEHGKTYRYVVSATDQLDHESDQSTASDAITY